MYGTVHRVRNKRGHSILGITLTHLHTVSYFATIRFNFLKLLNRIFLNLFRGGGTW